MARERGRSTIAVNRRARHDYTILDTYQAGLVLLGTEVKSLRAGRATLADGYGLIKDGEVWLQGVHIPEYEPGTWTNHDPRRPRKLLLHKREIGKIIRQVDQSGRTLVPLKLYFSDGYAKVEIAVAQGRRAYDKRQAIAERESQREMARALGRRDKGMDG